MKKSGEAHRRKRGRPCSDLKTLFQRQRGRCHYCKRPMNLGGGGPSHATRDHVVPRAQGGKDAGNLVAACVTCNQRKGCMDVADFWQWLNSGWGAHNAHPGRTQS